MSRERTCQAIKTNFNLPGKEVLEKDAERSNFLNTKKNVKNGSVMRQRGYHGNFWVVTIILLTSHDHLAWLSKHAHL